MEKSFIRHESKIVTNAQLQEATKVIFEVIAKTKSYHNLVFKLNYPKTWATKKYILVSGVPGNEKKIQPGGWKKNFSREAGKKIFFHIFFGRPCPANILYTANYCLFLVHSEQEG